MAALLERTPTLKVHSVSLRLKSRESLAGKLARPDRVYRSLWSITDLVGVRVIVYFEDDVDRVGRLLESHLGVDYTHSIDKRRREAPIFGYRSLHYVCAIDPGGRAGLPPEGRFEVQIRSVLEHAWAEIEHDLGYKGSSAMPAAALRRLHRVAGLLELADQEFCAIRDDLQAYAAHLPDRIATGGDDVPLDLLSLDALLGCDEVRDVDGAIAHVLERDLGDDPFFPDYLVRMLVSSGIASVGEARAGVARNAARIGAMARPYFDFAWEAWQLSPARMDRVFRGYSLFFLAHIEVLRSPALGIDKVARLAALYRALDYPDDERAAQRVASRLVEAFGQLVGDADAGS